MKNLLTPLAKSVLKPLGLTAAVSVRDAAIKNKLLGSRMAALLISNKAIDKITKNVKSLLKESGLLIKSVTKTIKDEAEGPKCGFLGMLLGTLAGNLLVNSLVSKRVTRGVDRVNGVG